MNFRYITKLIENLKRKYNTECPYELASCLNIMIIIEPLGKALGIYAYLNKTRTIFIDSDLNEYERRFVLAHEIGHALLHTKSSCFFNNTHSFYKSKREYEANIFASEFLVNLDYTDELYLEGYSIGQLASFYKVPIELIEFKFKERRNCK